eukprot:TRINITY_DN10880_c0_g1_i3.p1 TRINITY_DN10880_c0_g1~~TRINITY_DN10880_c0_g1_i3.p1  ORF type:complete len:399 (+),score=85.43 TRINITY_DN10880_c0_g1_i3:84-1199(+)
MVTGARTLLLRKGKGKEKPDPYCIVEYKGQEFATEVLKRTCNPRWNQTFQFSIPDKDALGDIGITVLDQKNSLKRKNHIFLGEIRLPVSDYVSINFDYTDQHRFELQKKGGSGKSNVGGTIDFKIGMKLPENSTRKSKPTRTRSRREGEEGERRTTEEIIKEAEDVVDSSYESVQRTLNMAQTTTNLAGDILDNLHVQGETITKTQRDVDDIDVLLDRNEKHLRVIESPFGGLKNKFKRKKKKDGAKAAEKAVVEQREKIAEERQLENKKIIKTQKQKAKRAAAAEAGEAYKPDVSMLSTEAQDKIVSTDNALDEIGNLVANMKNFAIAIGDEIDDHNTRINHLQQGVARVEERGKHQSDKVNRALGGKKK